MSKSLIDRAEQLLAQTKAEYAAIHDTPTGITLRIAELLRDLVADARRDDLDLIVSRLKALEIAATAAAPVDLGTCHTPAPDTVRDEAITVFAEHLAERFYKRARDLDAVDTREARFWRTAAEALREEAGLL